MSNFRAFLAIDLPETTKKELEKLIVVLKKKLNTPKIKWVNPKNLHLTLKFLGDINEKQKECLAQNAPKLLHAFLPFQINFSTLKLFPSLNHPRVIALFPFAHDQLLKIALTLENLAFQIGIAKEKRPFLPHLTLARISNEKFFPLPKVPLPNLSFLVDQIKLFKSELHPESSIYTELFSFKLKEVQRDG
jgi:RNA 2',3'-cyclic 3'-phosphodiesterase